jgi:hypothetical protein
MMVCCATGRGLRASRPRSQCWGFSFADQRLTHLSNSAIPCRMVTRIQKTKAALSLRRGEDFEQELGADRTCSNGLR